MVDTRIRELRRRLREAGSPEHAEFHKNYHRSRLSFYGLKTPAMRSTVRAVFPVRAKLERDEALALVEEIWSREWFEERFAALELLERVAPELTLRHLPLLRRFTKDCDGWVLLDHLACKSLGPMGIALGSKLYDKVRPWSKDKHLWTRRASILVHIAPARAEVLSHAHAWPTFEALLDEPDFFIRKALGWTLRECSKKHPERVANFLLRCGDSASRLTRREGARNLPKELRLPILGS